MVKAANFAMSIQTVNGLEEKDVWIGKPSREAQGINFFVLFFFSGKVLPKTNAG